MLTNLVKQSLRTSMRIGSSKMMVPAIRMTSQMNAMQMVQTRSYYKDNVLMTREYGEGYMSDPHETAEKIVRLLALHDNLKINPSQITVSHSFDDLGLNELDMCEVFVMLEKEFDFEISEEDCESMTTVNDLVEHVARSFYSKG